MSTVEANLAVNNIYSVNINQISSYWHQVNTISQHQLKQLELQAPDVLGYLVQCLLKCECGLFYIDHVKITPSDPTQH